MKAILVVGGQRICVGNGGRRLQGAGQRPDHALLKNLNIRWKPSRASNWNFKLGRTMTVFASCEVHSGGESGGRDVARSGVVWRQ